jgi:hypothetical protein
MNLAKLHEIVAVAGMNGKKEEILLNPHSVVACRVRLGGGSLITLQQEKRSQWQRARRRWTAS